MNVPPGTAEAFPGTSGADSHEPGAWEVRVHRGEFQCRRESQTWRRIGTVGRFDGSGRPASTWRYVATSSNYEIGFSSRRAAVNALCGQAGVPAPMPDAHT